MINLKNLKSNITKMEIKGLKSLEVKTSKFLKNEEIIKRLIFSSEYLVNSLSKEDLRMLVDTTNEAIKSGIIPIFGTKKFSYCFLSGDEITSICEELEVKKYQLLNNILTNENMIGTISYEYDKIDSLGFPEKVRDESNLYLVEKIKLDDINNLKKYVEAIPLGALTERQVKDLRNRIKEHIKKIILEQLKSQIN